MKKKVSQLRLNKKQISMLNASTVKGGLPMWTNACPEETVQITMCYGAIRCQKWPPMP
ncbi:hypothetical protein [Kordia zhangzhouensis]|uniref:hypothetical protein n=1 Tax=Kordia zhangzhouensis TaxID=1620405 RepID=UPI0012DFEB1B|nr:hypothetical protein [Kordia zhangzhouensis]